DVHVDSRLVVVPVLVRVGALGPFPLRDLVLERGELLLQLRVRRLLKLARPPRLRSRLLAGRRRGAETERRQHQRSHDAFHLLPPPASSPQISFRRRSRPQPTRYRWYWYGFFFVNPWWYSSAG